MRVVTTLLMLIGLAVVVVLLLPVFGLAIALAFAAGGFLIWLLPILIIAMSDRTTGPEKVAWILAIIFLSWFAWIFYFLLAPIRAPERDHYLRDGAGRYSRYSRGGRYDYR